MKDYSQHGEQDIILDYFNGQPYGWFLDIGANDGVTFSNTHGLYWMGWVGVCVDASPTAFEALSRNYNGALISCIHAAITDRDGTITLHDCSDSLVSSLSAGAEQIWKHHNFDWKPVEVPCMTMETLYERVGTRNFGFINIDAEGHDLEILRQVDLGPVKMLCVEYGKHFKEVVEHCKGFRVLLNNGVNVILAR